MSCYSKLFSSSPEYKSIKHNTERGSYPFGVLGLPPTPKAFLIHTLNEEYRCGSVVLVPDEATGEKLYRDLTVLGSSCALYPARDFNFQSVETSSREYEQKRIGALSKMLSGECNIMILSVEAVMQKTLPKNELTQRTFSLEAGQEISTEEIRTKLVKCGYTYADMVEGPGQFSARGGIIDIFPCNLNEPVRIEFWGDEIDTISYFDIITQRRTTPAEKIFLAPVTEVLIDDPEALADKLTALKKGLKTKNADKVREFLTKDSDLLHCGLLPGCCDKYLPLVYEKPVSPLDYFPDSFLFVCESSAIKERGASQEKLSNEELKELFTDGVLCKGLDGYYCQFSDITEKYKKSKTVYTDNFTRGSFDTPVKDLINYHINQISAWDGSYKILLEDIAVPVRNKYTVVIFAGTDKAAEGLLEELADDELPAILCKSTPGQLQKGYITFSRARSMQVLIFREKSLLS